MLKEDTKRELSKDDLALQWALPEALDVPPDRLKLRLDFYGSTVLMHVIDEHVVKVRQVSPSDIASALTGSLGISSGLLPEGTLWYTRKRGLAQVAIWRRPQVWRVALQMDLSHPPRRFALPMPGLIFICSPTEPPWVYAALRRSKAPDDLLYHAPLFNVFRNGMSCPGTHKYPGTVEDVPESFFASFFSPTGDNGGRSKRYPSELLKLWEDLDGRRRYTVDDLVPICTVKELLEGAR